MASVGQWGGLWQTVCELPDAKDALPDLAHTAKGFATLEAARTVPGVKTALLEWFGDKHTRNRLNSPLLDQLHFLFTAPLSQNVYIAATVFGLTAALVFLLRLDDAPPNNLLSHVLGWAEDYHRDDIVEYLSQKGVLPTHFVIQTPFQLTERVFTSQILPSSCDVLYWIEPVTQGEAVRLIVNADTLLTFSGRLVFDTPFPFLLLPYQPLSVSSPVRCGTSYLTNTSRRTIFKRVGLSDIFYHLKATDSLVHFSHGCISRFRATNIATTREFVDVLDTKPGTDQDPVPSPVAPLRAAVTFEVSDEQVQEIKRLTGLSYTTLFGFE